MDNLKLKPIETVGIVGMGALGLLYGKQISDGGNADKVFYVMDTDRKAKYAGSFFTVNEDGFDVKMLSSEEAFTVDLLIFAVKYPSLDEALETAAPFIGEGTTIISVMNGIVSEEIIGDRFGADKVVCCVAQGMDAMKFGNALKYTKTGALFVGMPEGKDAAHLDRLTEFFEKYKVDFVKEKDIAARMWFKFMLNVGINQTCMVYGVPYGVATKPGKENDMMVAAMREVIAIAEAEGITLTEEQLFQCIEIEKTLDPNATPSMGQDRISRRKSEVELFAGTVIKYAEKHGIPCPANRFYYEQVKQIEEQY